MAFPFVSLSNLRGVSSNEPNTRLKVSNLRSFENYFSGEVPSNYQNKRASLRMSLWMMHPTLVHNISPDCQ